MKVLITGASGQVGRALQDSAPSELALLSLTHSELDISDARAVQRAVAAWHPAVVINAAAYTAVDKAESEPEASLAINAEGPRHLAQAALAMPGCRLIHISTDYVFDGGSAEPYGPSHRTHPLSVYGRGKLLGEQAVVEILADRGVILRTAWVYAAQGKNFLLTMLRLMRERGAVRVVADQFGSPTSADSIARALWVIARRPEVHGLLHWTDAGKTTWYDFAQAIAEEGAAAGLLPPDIEVTAITTAQYPTAARRPASSVLDTRRSVELLGIVPPPWRAQLRATLARLKAA